MYHRWQKKSQQQIKETIFKALGQNINYNTQSVIGVPASFLDDKVFNQDEAFIKEAPFISTLVQNPNHIGCHTLGTSEPFFKGTQALELELLEICAVDILKAEPLSYDGYVASGGTEANLQAIWVYRNYFMQKHGAQAQDIAIICSQDSHYSMDKAANLLSLAIYKCPLAEETRVPETDGIKQTLQQAKRQGKKHFIVVCNMMTTMFGSVDDINAYTQALETEDCHYKLHVDGAYGGFYYPFTDKESQLTFTNPHISSFTLDAHKMAQAPYGTGIFLIRKGFIEYVNTQEASYVEGEDYTLIGSRSGANAVAVWMILMKNGPFGWQERIFILQKRTEWMCQQLQDLGFSYYRHPKSNIITIRAEHIHESTAHKFGLVPDTHHKPNWYKIVLMEHVTIEKLMQLLEDIKGEN